MTRFDPLQPVVVISTHLDDAVLSCAQFIHANSGVTVVTVLAGAPEEYHVGYNSRTTGEAFAPNAMKVRRDEDAKAMSMLSAHYVWLDFHDNDYLQPHPRSDDKQAMRDALSQVLNEKRPKTVLSPLGLMHPDHLAVSDACLELAKESAFDWYLYLDMPYGLAVPKVVPERLAEVAKKVNVADPESFLGDLGIKRDVMKLYASQFAPTRSSHRKGFRATMKATELYWKITDQSTDSPSSSGGAR